MITIRFDSKFGIIAQLFDSIRFQMKKHYSHNTSFFINISQGSAVTLLRCSGIFNDCFILRLISWRLWKSLSLSQFPEECDSESIPKISQYRIKFCVEYRALVVTYDNRPGDFSHHWDVAKTHGNCFSLCSLTSWERSNQTCQTNVFC